MTNSDLLASILGRYPSFIPLPKISRPHRPATSDLKHIEKSDQLPSRFFFGDLVPDSFQRTNEGWEVTYIDPERHGCSILKFQNTDSNNTPSLLISNQWRGVEKSIWITAPDRFVDLSDRVVQSYSDDWDKNAKTRLCGKYNVEYLPNQPDTYLMCGIPDGFFRSLAVPLPVHMLRPAFNCHISLQKDSHIHTGIASAVHMTSSVVNYVVGKNNDVLSNPNHIFLKTIQDLGRPPQYQPVEEYADDGSSAITNRREHYMLVVGFTLRDMDRVVEVLLSFGLIGDRSERLSNDDFPHAPEYAGVILQSGLEVQPIEFNYFDEHQRRRTYYHQFSELRNVDQLKQSEQTDPRPLIEDAESAMEEMYKHVLEVIKTET